MQRSSKHRARPSIGRTLAIAAGLVCAAALSQPNLAEAHGVGGGGGFHNSGMGGFHGGRFGGFHGGGMGGFHGGGMGGFHGGRFGEFHGGFAGFHRGGFRGERFHDGRFDHDRFRDRRFFFGGAVAYPWWGYYPDYGYYDYSQPYASQTWYYCSDPTGYYPYVAQCNTGWQTVPAN